MYTILQKEVTCGKGRHNRGFLFVFYLLKPVPGGRRRPASGCGYTERVQPTSKHLTTAAYTLSGIRTTRRASLSLRRFAGDARPVWSQLCPARCSVRSACIDRREPRTMGQSLLRSSSSAVLFPHVLQQVAPQLGPPRTVRALVLRRLAAFFPDVPG